MNLSDEESAPILKAVISTKSDGFHNFPAQRTLLNFIGRRGRLRRHATLDGNAAQSKFHQSKIFRHRIQTLISKGLTSLIS